MDNIYEELTTFHSLTFYHILASCVLTGSIEWADALTKYQAKGAK